MKKISWQKIKANKTAWLLSLVVFVFCLVIFGALNWQKSFLDPDSFYHAKMVELTAEQGIVKSFPWLPLTVLNDYYIDQHYLYHLLAVPFFLLFGALVGLKVATVFFAALFVATLYWLINKTNSRVSSWTNLVFVFLLLASSPIVFRLNLAKAPALSLIFLFVGWYLIINRRYFWLFIFSFVYVYLYGGWPLILVILAATLLVNWLSDTWLDRKKYHSLIASLAKNFFTPVYWKLLGATLAGLAAGIVINPYFPNNIKFYWQQLVQIGIINYQKVVRVGAEWHPYGLRNLFLDTPLLSIVLLVVLLLFILNWRRQSRIAWIGLLLTVFFFITTLKSQRYVEYYVPMGVFFSAASLSLFLEREKIYRGYFWLKNFYNKNVFVTTFLAVFWILAVSILAGRGWIINSTLYYSAGRSFSQFSTANVWIKNNVPAGVTIFHSDWDEFPQLFYHNSSNYYIAGLDPTFLYKKDPALYKKFEDITLGKVSGNLGKEIKNSFGADYIFVELSSHDSLVRNLKNSPDIRSVYQDSETEVFVIE